MEPVDDPGEPRLDDLRDLRHAGGPLHREASLDHVVVEGTLALARAVAAGVDLRRVVTTPAREAAARAALGDRHRVEVLVVTPECLREVTGFDAHRGVLASAERPAARSAAEVLVRARRPVVVEEVNDLENLGSLFRVAAALGLDAVLVDPRCADPHYRRCIRVSMGWSLALPWARLDGLPEGLDPLREAGIPTVALTPSSQAVAIDEAAATGLLDDPVALVVGAEGPGLTEATLGAVDAAVRIPMAGDVDSLNVATALAVVAAFAAARRGWTG